jgi:hypothetical protein
MPIANTLLEILRLLLKETTRLTLLTLPPYSEVLKGKSLGYGEVYEELLLLRNRSETAAARLALVRAVVSLRERLRAARDELSMFRQNVEALTPIAAKNWSLRTYLDQEINRALVEEGRVEVLQDWTKMLEEDAVRLQIVLPDPTREAQQKSQQGICEWLEIVASRPGETICIAQYRREDGSYELSLRGQTYDPTEILKLLSLLHVHKSTIQAAVDRERA